MDLIGAIITVYANVGTEALAAARYTAWWLGYQMDRRKGAR